MGNTCRTTNTNTFFTIGPLRMMSATADRSAEAYTPQLGSVQHYCRKIRPETSGASLMEKLRPQFGLPGMSLLQFTYGNHPLGPSFRPHNYSRDRRLHRQARQRHDGRRVVRFGQRRQTHSRRCPPRTRLRARLSPLPRRFRDQLGHDPGRAGIGR